MNLLNIKSQLARWLIIMGSGPLLLFNLMWVLHGTFAPMGWGGRSVALIVVTMLLGVWLPVAASSYFVVLAIGSSRQSLSRSGPMLLFAALCIFGGWAFTLITGLMAA